MNLDAALSSIMTSTLESVGPRDKILALKHIYEQPRFHSHVPVIEQGKIVGVVSLINFMHAIKGATLDDSEAVYNTTEVGEIMTEHPETLRPDSTIRDAVKILSRGEFHSILIAIEGELKGIVTTTDILKLLGA